MRIFSLLFEYGFKEKISEVATAQLHAAIKRVKSKEVLLRQVAVHVLYHDDTSRSMLSDHVHGKDTRRYVLLKHCHQFI